MLTIKEAAERVNLSTHTLRYYESEGLFPFLERDDLGRRVYRKKDIEWIQFICCLRNTGMSIREMKSFVSLYEKGETTIKERMDILYEHRRLIEKQLQETQQYLKNINRKICYYEGVYKDELAKKGQGCEGDKRQVIQGEEKVNYGKV